MLPPVLETSPALRRPTEASRWYIAIVVFGTTATLASAMGWTPLHWIAKPLTTSTCLALAWAGGDGVSARYRGLVVAGMVLGLVGDVALMLPGDAFVTGLGAFLLGHLCYLAAFVGNGGWRMTPWPLLPLGAACGAFFGVVGDRTGALFMPVAAYATIISLTAWQANARAAQPGGRAAGAGMFLFVLSDLVLAADRFGDVLPSPADRVVILGTYWAAQGCIATSVGGRRAIA